MLTSRTKILNKINGKEKGKACQNKLNSFSTVEKRQKMVENLVEEVQWPKTIPNLLKSINPNTENKKKTLIMRKQLSFRGLRKNRRITVTYWPSEERTLNSQLQVFMKAYSGYSKLRTNSVKNNYQSEDPLDFPKSLGEHWKLNSIIMVLFFIVQPLLHPGLGCVTQFIE